MSLLHDKEFREKILEIRKQITADSTNFVELNRLNDELRKIVEDYNGPKTALEKEVIEEFARFGEIREIFPMEEESDVDEFNAIITKIEDVTRTELDAVTDIQKVFRGHSVRKKRDELRKKDTPEENTKDKNPTDGDTTRNKIDEEIDPAEGYYEYKTLAKKKFFLEGDGPEDVRRFNVREINGLVKKKGEENKTIFVTDDGFPLFEYNDDGLTSAFEIFQQDISRQYAHLNSEEKHSKTSTSIDNSDYNSISFVRIRNSNNVAGGDNSNLKSDGAFNHAIVYSTDNSVETCYLSDESFRKIRDDYNSEYSDLLNFRRKLNALEDEYNIEEDKKAFNDSFITELEKAGIDVDEIKGFNSYANHIDDLAAQGNIKKLVQANIALEVYLKNTGRTLNIENKAADPYFVNRVKVAHSNNFHKEFIKSAQKSREENRVGFNLTAAEKQGIKDLGGHFPKFNTYNKRESENIDTLLNIDFPATSHDGVYVKRVNANPFDLNNTFGRDSVNNEFAAIVFKGDTTDNIMYLTLKGTDFHVKVRMDPDSKEIQIDPNRLYKKDKFGKWSAYDSLDISRKVSEGILDKRNKNIKAKLRNFGVIAMSDVDGVRKVTTFHNLKARSCELQSTLSKDIFGDVIDNKITANKTPVSDLGLAGDVDLLSQKSSSPIDRVDSDDKVLDGVVKDLGKVEKLLTNKADNLREELLNKAFSYSVSKNIYEKRTENGRDDYFQVGYQLQRIAFAEDGSIAGTQVEYISNDNYNALTRTMSEFKKDHELGKIDDDTYKKCKNFVMNTLDDVVQATKSQNIAKILEAEEQDDPQIYQSAAKYRQIAAKSGPLGNIMRSDIESEEPLMDRTLRRLITNKDQTKGVRRHSETAKVGEDQVQDLIKRMGTDMSNSSSKSSSFQERIVEKGSSNVGRGSGMTPAA